MDEEKMQRHMEFLLEWQAQFAAELAELKERDQRNSENITRLEGVVERVVGVVERLADGVSRLTQVTTERFEAVERQGDETDRKLAALVDAQMRTEEEARKREESMRSLEETMRSLAATVERHIADGHGGKEYPES